MPFTTINTIACGLIALWATWCVLAGRVRDGVIGKLIYSAIAISGFVVTARNQSLVFGQSTAVLTMHATLAMAGVRRIFMVTWWPGLKVWLCHALRCEHCLKDCRYGPGGIKRRNQ
ncbi:hypothetical protein K4A76_14060 [Pseudomonas sp. NEEL19]|uniref:hypothetical protein n=1 Tax=Pseudomonas sp. NEEL19 TaxID=2867409 RepID=UPI0023677CA7|nr:hypothetical protein [Pseudomonas sp. NEEL19]WDM61684.1 hypothetical protein K4A76_14060 [Pseudomonas sp. NEEL19]